MSVIENLFPPQMEGGEALIEKFFAGNRQKIAKLGLSFD